MRKIGVVDSIFIGKAIEYAHNTMSAINKKQINTPQYTNKLGFIHDEQGDLRVHGGVEKAIHIYPIEHYDKWKQETTNPSLFKSGAFGENISSRGITEQTICLADKIKIGTTILEVSQGRMPCWKLNIHFKDENMALKLQDTLRTGWYFRVLKDGYIAPEDDILLIERPYPEWPLSNIMKPIFDSSLNKEELVPLSQLPLVESWKKLIQKRIDTNNIENWSPRIYGPLLDKNNDI